jgi:elongation factor Ts
LQAAASGKAGKFVQKMIEGRLSKWFEEVCLSEQRYLLDDTVRVTTLLEQLSTDMKLQPPLQLAGMMRVQCGEGLRGTDAPKAFADEVAAIVKG